MSQKQRKSRESGTKPGDFEQESPKETVFNRDAVGKDVVEVTPVREGARLESYSLAELLELRGRIDKLLPPRSLADVDLEEEVLLQYARTKALYDAIAEDSETPANQRAQVANSCTTILGELIKMQSKLYGAERVKVIEQVLVRVLRTLPEAQQLDFFERYERALEELGLASKGPAMWKPLVNLNKGPVEPTS